MRAFWLCLPAVTLIALPATAGDEVLYEAPPHWVEPADINTKNRDSGSPIVFLDQQARIENGQLWTFVETAIALDSPEALTRFGTLSAAWLPDKGDLRIHRAELLRDDETIDLLAQGGEFEVLRRERGLEFRLLDGALTATMPVSGARLGDVIRLAYSTTVADQAMGENAQWQAGLIAKPFPLADGRIQISWPRDLEVSRVKLGSAEVSEPVLKNGYMTWTAALPVDELKEYPGDAPSRYHFGNLMQVATYSDWRAVSSNMARHYDPANTITPGGSLADEIAAIGDSSDDELTRAALAVQLVQDQISYLLNGMNGGNYLPQSPEETWERRFGDCKAKSLLLLAILRELGIKAEAALVRSSGGDALPQLAPMPGDFDHVIVRAEIGGESYWLDGTAFGTRLDTIDIVPRFHFALPLREEGADLMPLGQRPQSTPDRIVRIKLDHRAGIRLPSLFDIVIEFRGTLGAPWRTVSEQGDAEARENAVNNAIQGIIGDGLLIDHSITYDRDAGVALVTGRGIQATSWSRDRTSYEFEAPAQAARNVSFKADRARAAWRDISLRLNGPVYHASEVEVLLPEGSGDFELDGLTDVNATIGGVELTSTASFGDDRFQLSQTMRSIREELPASEISDAKRGLARFERSLPILKTSKDIRQPWEYFGKDRKRLAQLEAAYAKSIADADPDEIEPLVKRAGFRSGVYDFSGALEDVEAAIAIEASRDLYLFRSGLRRELGDLEGALEDLRLCENLTPDGSTYQAQVELLALLDRSDEGVELAESFQGLAENSATEDTLMAMALGWSGSKEEGLELLESLAAQRPGDGSLLNTVCWYAGIWNVMDQKRLTTCVDAVEKSDWAPAALDSRALAYLRLGNLEGARADLDAVLLAEPGMAPSRLLRGIVRKAQGDAGAADEIALAFAMQPSLAATYSAWGLDF